MNTETREQIHELEVQVNEYTYIVTQHSLSCPEIDIYNPKSFPGMNSGQFASSSQTLTPSWSRGTKPSTRTTTTPATEQAPVDLRLDGQPEKHCDAVSRIPLIPVTVEEQDMLNETERLGEKVGQADGDGKLCKADGGEKLDQAEGGQEKVDQADGGEEKLDQADGGEEKLDQADGGEEKLDQADRGDKDWLALFHVDDLYAHHAHFKPDII